MDMMAVAGAVLVVLALPVLLATLAERRIAPVALVLSLCGAGMMGWVLVQVPDPGWQVLADAAIRVIARIF